MRFLMLSMLVVLFAGCSKDDEPTKEPEKEVVYSVTYSVNKISDDFFTLGHFTLTYADKDGKKQTVKLEKASQVPFSVTVEGLKADDKLYFDMIYASYPDVELANEKYTFAREAFFKVNGSDGSMHSESIISNSLTVGKDKVKDYLNKVASENHLMESVINDLIQEK